MSQSLAQEPRTGRLGGQECIHGQGAAHSPIQQACRPNQEQLPEVITAQSRSQGPGSELQLVQGCGPTPWSPSHGRRPAYEQNWACGSWVPADHHPSLNPGPAQGTGSPLSTPQSIYTWRPRGLNGGFQDTGQGLEEDSKGLSPQCLWTRDRGPSKGCCPGSRANQHKVEAWHSLRTSLFSGH